MTPSLALVCVCLLFIAIAVAVSVREVPKRNRFTGHRKQFQDAHGWVRK